MTSPTGTSHLATPVVTADGPLDPSALGITLPHEHLLLTGWDHHSTNYFNSMYMELLHFASAGGGTVVDAQPVGRPRDPLFAKRVAAEAGLKVVIGTGYARDAALPESVREAATVELADQLVADITTGIDGLQVRAGLIADIEVSRRIRDSERRTLAAAAIAQSKTGAALSIRPDVECEPLVYDEVLDLVASAGADLTRVAIFGLVPRPRNLELLEAIAGRGCFLGFDLFGQDHRQLLRDLVGVHSEVQASSIKGLLDRGLGESILLSQGINNIELMWVNGGYGYGHLCRDVLPLIRKYRVRDEDILELLVTNPRRWLAGA